MSGDLWESVRGPGRAETAPYARPRIQRLFRPAGSAPRSPLLAIEIVGLLLATLLVGPTSSLPAAGAAAPATPVSVVREAGGAIASSSLTISSFGADPPTVIKSNPVYFNVSTSGGSPPLTYTYQGLPPGCVSHNVSSLLCYPVSIESYVVTVVVNDSVGASANASTPLSVTSGYGGPPTISAFYADPSSVGIDQKTLLVVNATSGSSTPTVLLTILFLDLPAGCASFNQTPLECIPSVAGHYKIWARVTDGFGDYAQTFAYLNVTGGASTASTSSLGGSLATFAAIGIGLLAAVVVVALIVRSRRRNRGPVRPYPGQP